ncbi:AraC family transcriptional regulator [Aquincola tertiaricarbonis]|uniref:AraC family transcriptional regulator n=1 Tax=Aquincola tertiaricarbonis TaxID=391953 RepID=UPI000614EA42|nr:AraC family transcriptional regulator [Aquincola tertiaricarbonis]
MPHAIIGRMQGVPDQFEHPADRAEFRRPAHRAGMELYRAHIVRHAFEPHTHQAFGIGAIVSGVERFRYRGTEHLAPAGSVVLMNPDELHTGRAETAQGWSYRMLYLDAELLQALTGDAGWWFDGAVRHDALLAARLQQQLHRLWQATDALAVDGALLDLLQLLRPAARIGRPLQPASALRFGAVIDCMHDRLAEPLTLAELAAVADLSPFHFQRSFKAAHGATPHQMLMALRLLQAKRRLAAGQPPASVAAAVGLADQAHLTRAFSRRYGVTPARYARQVG